MSDATPSEPRKALLWRDRRWWRYLLTKGLSAIANGVGQVALPSFLIVERGAALMGLYLGAVTLATALCLPLTGNLADRAARGALIRGGYVVSAIAPILLLTGTGDSTVVAVAAAITGVGVALGMPASRAGLADLVRADDLSRAQGTVVGLQNIIGIVAPAIGGVVIALWSANGLLMAQIGAFVLAAVCTPALPRAKTTAESKGRAGITALRTVLRARWLRAGFVQASAQILLGFAPGLVLIRIVATERYGSEGLGLVLSASAVAALAGTTLAAVTKPARPGLWANLGFMVYVPVFLTLAFPVPLSVMLAAVVVGGVGISLHGVWWYTALNHACPPDVRGRLHAVDAGVTRIVEPVGMAGAVPAVALVGMGAVAGLSAVVFLLAGSLTLLVPGFSRYGAAGARPPKAPASPDQPERSQGR
ncbi:MFS transporter [Streptomyces sp. NPDC001142]